MGTHSLIGMEQEDGGVAAIYCHYDGHPWTNGKILLVHYSDPDKARALLALGDMSSLHERPGECTVYETDPARTKRMKFSDIPSFLLAHHRHEASFAYVFTREGVWKWASFVNADRYGPFRLVELTETATMEPESVGDSRQSTPM